MKNQRKLTVNVQDLFVIRQSVNDRHCATGILHSLFGEVHVRIDVLLVHFGLFYLLVSIILVLLFTKQTNNFKLESPNIISLVIQYKCKKKKTSLHFKFSFSSNFLF